MLRLSLFATRQFDAINVTTVLFYGAYGAASYPLVLQCELQLGYSASQAGAAVIPQAAVFLAVSQLSGALVSRVGPRRLMVAGILLVAAAFACRPRRTGDRRTPGPSCRRPCSGDSASAWPSHRSPRRCWPRSQTATSARRRRSTTRLHASAG
jgi:hypothetical protein